MQLYAAFTAVARIGCCLRSAHAHKHSAHTHTHTCNNRCVTATGPLAKTVNKVPIYTEPDTFASTYSNYGVKSIDVAAPGGYQGSVFAACSTFCAEPDFLEYPCVKTETLGLKGTSMAAPHVSGVLALILAEKGGNASPVAALRTLLNSADDLGAPGTDELFGRGR
jgi:Subtilase family